ncbi:MAG: hypothetical protein E6J03_04545 [Chloroflexi bacterium]|nr:MAG: hypothetical protein E6J03_04545 [Chloroflexota bacterium]
MSDLRHEVDEIGRRIWPDSPAAYRAMQARRRRWWLTLLQPRRPQLAMRWLPVLAAVATVAIFVALAGNHPAVERTEHPGTHTLAPTPVSPGAPEGLHVAPPLGRSIAVAPSSHPAAPAPPAANPPGTGAVATTGGDSPASPQRPSSTGSGVVTVTLTEADSGKTITVAPGTRIVVTLQAAPHRQWSAPRSLDSTVLTASDTARDAGGGAHGTFVASKPGHTRLVAGQGGCHGPLCLIASATTWQVRVVVR